MSPLGGRFWDGGFSLGRGREEEEVLGRRGEEEDILSKKGRKGGGEVDVDPESKEIYLVINRSIFQNKRINNK